METAEQKLKPTTYLDTGKLRRPSEPFGHESREEDIVGRPYLRRTTQATSPVH